MKGRYQWGLSASNIVVISFKITLSALFLFEMLYINGEIK